MDLSGLDYVDTDHDQRAANYLIVVPVQSLLTSYHIIIIQLPN